MIELNKKTQQDFLNREWVQRLLDAGVNMSDARYCIINGPGREYDVVILKRDYNATNDPWIKDGISKEDLAKQHNFCPTYTVSELLYKLHEWIYPTIGDKEYSGGLTMMKNDPFYMFYYKLRHDNGYLPDDINEDYIYAESEYPIESLAMLLIQCHKKDIGIKAKDTGDISGK